MSTGASASSSGMRPEAARRRIEVFHKRFGNAHLYLAYHAAFPIALTPDLVYRLRATFQRDGYGELLNIPWIAVADLLLSSLCDEVGYELYEMNVAVRHELLSLLREHENFGDLRISELSNFLFKYVYQQLNSHDPDTRDFAHAQYWTALVVTRPEEAAHSIALTLSKLDPRDRAGFARMKSLIETLGEPSDKFATLLAYTKSMEQYARGNEEQVRVELETTNSKMTKWNLPVDVRDIDLSNPQDLQTLEEETRELSLPQMSITGRPAEKLVDKNEQETAPAEETDEPPLPQPSIISMPVEKPADEHEQETAYQGKIHMDMLGIVINGRYRILDVIGSNVYIARDTLTNHIYAAKIMHPDHSDDSELLERFKRGTYILQSLNNEHIVRLLDYGHDGSIYFIVIEHVDGRDLKWYITTYGPVEALRGFDYIIQAAEGLDAIFKAGIVHRDIKPQHILINTEGIVKIAGFGLSRSSSAPTITSPDRFMGTAYYSSPEQMRSAHDADIRSDLYSLGAVLYESLVGHPPFKGDTVVDIILKHLNEPVPSIYRQRPDLPPEIDTFMQRAMAKSPAERFQTPREFINGLEAVKRILQGPVQETHQLQAQLLHVASGKTFPLQGEQMIIGRADPKHEIHPDIQLDDSTMTLGRRHARLFYQQGTWMVEDQNSRNKTRLNGKILTPYEPQPLRDGDLLQFGRAEARFEMI